MRGTVVCRVLILLLFFAAGSPPGFAQGNQPAGVGASDPRQPQGDIGDFPESEKPLGLVLKDDGSAFRSLMMAIGLEDGEALGELLNSGVSPDSADPESGLTALMIADTREMAELLLDHGADPALVDDEGATALHHALFAREAKELVTLLLSAKAPVDLVAEGWQKETPLLSARQLFFEGRDQDVAAGIVRLLAAHGAEPSAADEAGYTLLHTAAVNDKPALARVAIEIGTDRSKRCRDGKTAMDWARSLGRSEIVHVLEEAPPQPRD